jgi:hypothetical protein
MANCQACGMDIAGDMLFCPYCGTKRAVDTSGRPVELAQERLLGSIPDVRFSSMVRGDGRYTLLVTDERLVFAKMTEKDLRSMQPSKGLGGLAAFSRNDPESGTGAPYADRYNEMRPSEALDETEGNFYIRIKDVRSIQLSIEDEGESYNMGFLCISEQFTLVMKADHDDRDLMIAVFGDKVRW